MYNLKNTSEKSLVWSGTYDIIEPNDVTKTIGNYVKAVIKSLEKEKLIPRKN